MLSAVSFVPACIRAGAGDPVKKRRILWGWATGGPPKALPRELTYHPTFKSIVQQPVCGGGLASILSTVVAFLYCRCRRTAVKGWAGWRQVAELDELHEAVVADMAGSATVLPAGAETHVGTANATDAVITFKLPAKPAVFGFATQGLVSHDGANR